MAVKTRERIIVVGAGVFGASTALAFQYSNTYKDYDIVVVDRDPHADPASASHDLSKIVRSDYAIPVHIEMARAAMDMWLEDPFFKEFFHRVGMYRCQPDDFNQQSLQTYKQLGYPTKSRWMTVDEVRKQTPVFANADFGTSDKVMYNPDFGYVDAALALEATRREAFSHPRVDLVVGDVQNLTFDESGHCAGVNVLLQDGTTQELRGKVVLCTGARTATLLEKSAPERKELHAGERLKATGAISFTVRIDGELKERFDAGPVPVWKNRVNEVMGELVSYKDGLLKFNRDGCWTLEKDREILVPTDANLTRWVDDIDQNDIKKLCRETLVGLCGKELESCEIEEYRFCWDSYTPNHDFFIGEHPRCDNLYFATGGSFHGWKFLPVIGKKVVAMLEGKLSQQEKQMWAWDRTNPDAANTTYHVNGALEEMQ
ncbi:unnamed protein product [Colletotrichum noveboracense]|uniref:FAD dependent oxidoreductase domain-containing protein n=1 Tax=Colletotrichum noveboracense TaxID=2664923 RepID=A0A9W4S395_9PEZI|nr:hypothetical protein COL940_011119 [Colletotrichum noveboracense]KAJ0293450.1 hypothetical protein CBS470a_001876 [Colletotrichum nupharicola]CAI0652161.1 unnamed protein product [Colletotrichum noveboracense]